ncbi:efflux RND transporter permease subunit [Novipirellula maiorica]|uniref:efflux RND transporter permease subunit n=1 Tax=Novipirellula maiorica TaxID=1265734 RepID=UPI001181A752|nr:MMPL family transporter [Rhodopirellula maiorica]
MFSKLPTLFRISWLADWIVTHRLVTFLILTIWTIVMGLGQFDPTILWPETTTTSPAQLDASDDDEFDESLRAKTPNVSPVQIAAGDVIVVAESDQFFTPEGADAIRDAVAALESLDQVDRVLWMDRAPMLNIFGLPEPILPQRNASPARFQAAKERALANPLIGGQLLSSDAKTLLLMVRIDWLFVTDDDDCTDALREAATAAVADHPGVEMKFQVTGEVPIRVSWAASTRDNERKYQMIGYSIALVIAYILFRGLSSVVIVALAPCFGVFWTLGLLHYLGFADNPFNSVIVPVLLCMVGFTDGVHMMVQIRRHRAEGMSATDAARLSIREVGLACWLTSLTTAIGFGSLALAHHEIVREFGYCCVIGVMMTFISVVTVIPLACASPLGRNVHSGYGHNLIDKNLSKISVVIEFVLRHFRKVSVAAIIVTLVLAAMTLQLRPDQRLTSNMSSGSESAMALAHIDKQFGGMETAEVTVQWRKEVASNDAEIGRVVAEVDDLLRSEPLIGNPLSIRSLIDALPGDGDPGTRMSLLELLPPPLKRAYFVPERRIAKVVMRLQDVGIASYGPVFQRIEQGLETIRRSHPNFRLELTGSAIGRWKNLYRIVVDLAFSLGTATLIIFAVLTFVYRSLRLGLISMIPNLFPLAMTGFILLVTGENLEMVSVCAFTVCLGIAVDDTIHFLTRYREELKTAPNGTEAIRRAFVGVGTALVMTTIVLIIGFSTALLSDARDHRIFAAMGILTIGSALFADLVMLPALLQRFAHQKETENEAAAP